MDQNPAQEGVTPPSLPTPRPNLPLIPVAIIILAFITLIGGSIIIWGIMTRLQALKKDLKPTTTPAPASSISPYVNPFKITQAPAVATTTPAFSNPFASPSGYQNPFSDDTNQNPFSP